MAGIKELTEQIARRVTPEVPSAKRVRPASREISSDGGEGPEVRPTALLVADSSGALDILVGVPAAALAEARSTPRATESVVASEEAQPAKFPSHPRSAAPSPSPIAEMRAAEEPTPVSVVWAVSRSRAPAAEIPSETAVQSALQRLLAIFEAARQLRPDVGLRDLRYREDAPCDRRALPVSEEFVPVLWRGVRHSSLRAVLLRKTPRR